MFPDHQQGMICRSTGPSTRDLSAVWLDSPSYVRTCPHFSHLQDLIEALRVRPGHNPTKVSFRASPSSLSRTRCTRGRDPESRMLAEVQITLDPGSRPAPRDLAGMTNCHRVSAGQACLQFETTNPMAWPEWIGP